MTEHPHVDTPEVKSRKNRTDIMIACAMGLLLYIAGSLAFFQYQDYAERAPATNWVEVTSLAVPNFKNGVDPVIEYERTIKQAVSSAWVAEIRHFFDGTDDYEVVCSRSGFSQLEPNRPAPEAGWTLGSFAGKECVQNITTNGRHRLVITWQLRPRGFDRTISYPISSNTFFVGEVSPDE